MAQSKRTKAAPQHVGKKQRKDPKAATEERARHSQATIPVVVFAGRTEDPEGVGEELIALLGGRSVAVRKGIRKTGEVPPRYAITDVTELVKGPGNAPEELGRLRSRYPEVFAKEVGRVRERHGDKITKCDFVRGSIRGTSKNAVFDRNFATIRMPQMAFSNRTPHVLDSSW